MADPSRSRTRRTAATPPCRRWTLATRTPATFRPPPRVPDLSPQPVLSAAAKLPRKANTGPVASAKHTAAPEHSQPNALWQHSALESPRIRFQAKLAVSAPSDPSELEADRMADQVMRIPEPSLQRECAACSASGTSCPKRKEEGRLQRKEQPTAAPLSLPGNFALHLGAERPLDPATRAFFEPRFGHSFNDVRVHADNRADAMITPKVAR